MCLGLCSPGRSGSGSKPPPPLRPSFDRRAQQPVPSRGGRLGCWNLIQPGGGGGAGARVLGEGPAPAFLPHSFSRPWGPRGSGGQLGTGSGSAQGRVSAGLPAHRATMSDPAVNAQLDGIISDFEGGCPTQRLLGEPGRSLQAGLRRDGASTGEAETPSAHPGALRPRSGVAYMESYA